MMHDVTKKIEEIAVLTKADEATVAKTLRLYGGKGGWQAGNRADEARVTRCLADAREAKRVADAKKALMEKLASGAAIWRKVGSEWMVQVTGQEVKVGDILDVERKDGTVAQVIVKSIAATRPDGIYCKV